ncbi:MULTISPECIES: NfeD family protein [Thermococcus]|uniref:Membrane protein n=1 Tax=Thermococcus sibiricus TaxID=172049 RepID=A0A101EMI0_9EURY|nr:MULTISPECIES: NfeD family protein [Thermococcus]KUK18067.1 MAG: Membrane protein [Thermococcus sibiricus]KUK28305.1 MAG: Membrane protein [Thermococcus sp. 40_45]MBC7094284.1 NfeD family protein [Thermococcus sp.]HII67343.1 NfeD family protein [Thermococcaceae archaeon]
MKTYIKNILKILSILADEIVVGIFLFFILPRAGIEVPLKPALAVIGFLIFKDVIAVKFLWEVFDKRVEVGPESLIGKEAMVVEELSPKGVVKVGNELWIAECINGMAKRREKVKIIEVRGTKLLVKRQE